MPRSTDLPFYGSEKTAPVGSGKSYIRSPKIRHPFFTIALCICFFILFYQHFNPIHDQPVQDSLPQQPVRPELTLLDWPTAGSSSGSSILITPELEVVVASLAKENTTWLSSFFPTWPSHVYVVDDPIAALTVPKNKGHESMVYLTYIIDHYDSLPSLILFLHASRYQWHNDNPDYDSLPLLRNLQLPYLRKQGYVNLRCAWILGCPTEIRPFEDLDSEDKNKATSSIYKAAFEELFPNETVPDSIGVTCCAQFAATRETIQQRSREDYAKWREWLLNTELEDEISGRVFEYSWHMIFGKPSTHCPKAPDCYCNVFGLCNLKCSDDACEGQYVLPKYSTMPNGWPLVGWQGEPRTFDGPL